MGGERPQDSIGVFLKAWATDVLSGGANIEVYERSREGGSADLPSLQSHVANSRTMLNQRPGRYFEARVEAALTSTCPYFDLVIVAYSRDTHLQLDGTDHVSPHHPHLCVKIQLPYGFLPRESLHRVQGVSSPRSFC